MPDSLRARFELFRASGRFFKHNAQELFAEESWVQVLLGQGFEMRPDPVTEFVADEELSGFLNDLAEVIEDVANTLPDHGTFVRGLPPNAEPLKPSTGTPAVTPNVSFTLRYERNETTA